VTLEAIQAAAAALNAMPDRPEAAMERVADLCVQHHLADPPAGADSFCPTRSLAVRRALPRRSGPLLPSPRLPRVTSLRRR
jgi:hypothetical protein